MNTPDCPTCFRPVIEHDPGTCCPLHGLPLTGARNGRRVCRDCWRADPVIQDCCGLAEPYHSHTCEAT